MTRVSYRFIKKQIYVNECSVFYLEGGTASSLDPILFVHGWGVATVPYQEVINILCQRYRVIAPDLPGLGNSNSNQVTWDYNNYANFLISFVKILNLKKVHLIGHSLGGGIIATFAALIPSIVSSLILVDSTGIPIDPIPKVFFQRLVEMTLQTPQIKIPQINQVFQGFLYNSCFKTQTTIQLLGLALAKDLKQLLPQIESPCLIVWGAKDMTTPLAAGKKFNQLIKGSKLVVVEEGYHEWIIFFADKLVKIVFDFLDEIEAIK